MLGFCQLPKLPMSGFGHPLKANPPMLRGRAAVRAVGSAPLALALAVRGGSLADCTFNKTGGKLRTPPLGVGAADVGTCTLRLTPPAERRDGPSDGASSRGSRRTILRTGCSPRNATRALLRRRLWYFLPHGTKVTFSKSYYDFTSRSYVYNYAVLSTLPLRYSYCIRYGTGRYSYIHIVDCTV